MRKKEKLHAEFRWGNLKEINSLKDLGEYGRISKRIAPPPQKKREDVDWIILAQDRDSCKHATRTLGSIK